MAQGTTTAYSLSTTGRRSAISSSDEERLKATQEAIKTRRAELTRTVQGLRVRGEGMTDNQYRSALRQAKSYGTEVRFLASYSKEVKDRKNLVASARVRNVTPQQLKSKLQTDEARDRTYRGRRERRASGQTSVQETPLRSGVGERADLSPTKTPRSEGTELRRSPLTGRTVLVRQGGSGRNANIQYADGGVGIAYTQYTPVPASFERTSTEVKPINTVVPPKPQGTYTESLEPQKYTAFGQKVPRSIQRKKEYAKQSFKSTFTGDVALQRELGIGNTAGGGNIFSSAGALATVPATVGVASAGAYGSVAVAGYTYGLFSTGTTAGVVGANLLSPLSATPIAVAGGYAYKKYQESPINTQLRQIGVDRKAFRRATTEGLSSSGGWGEVFTGFGSRSGYLTGFSQGLRREGIAPSNRLNELAFQQRRAVAGSELVGISLAGSSANVIGALNLGRATLKKGATVGFRQGFTSIGGAGLTEGFASSISQDVSRDRPVSIGRGLTAGAFGYLTAGFLGGAISQATSSVLPKTRRTLTSIGYVLDPTEFGSDALTGITRRPYGFSKPFGGGSAPSVEQPSSMRFAGSSSSPFSGSSRGSPSVRSVSFPISPLSRTRSVTPVNPVVPESSFPLVGSSPRSQPAPRGRSVSSPFVPSIPSQSDPFVPVQPEPFVPVPSNPVVPVTPPPFVPSDPFVGVPSDPNPLIGRILPFGGLGGSKGRFGFGKKGFGGGKTKARYTASFTAIELGISSTKAQAKSFTGFEIRPLFGSPLKKKKPKKKAVKTPKKKRATKKTPKKKRVTKKKRGKK